VYDIRMVEIKLPFPECQKLLVIFPFKRHWGVSSRSIHCS